MKESTLGYMPRYSDQESVASQQNKNGVSKDWKSKNNVVFELLN